MGETDMEYRKKRTATEGWLIGIECVGHTVRYLHDKRADALRPLASPCGSRTSVKRPATRDRAVELDVGPDPA